MILVKNEGRWSTQAELPWQIGKRKTPGLQGPIDDAFMEAFLFVRPTGKAANEKAGAWAIFSGKAVADRSCADRWCWAQYDDERADGQYEAVEEMCCPRGDSLGRSLEGRERLRMRDSGESFFRGGKLTANATPAPWCRSVCRRFSWVMGSMD